MTLTKDQFRQKCLKKMKNVPKHNKYYKDAMLNNRLMKHLQNVRGSKILFYYPLPIEANIIQSLMKLRRKCEIYLPFMQDKSLKIVPFRLPLKKKKFGIYEAGNTIKKIKKIDIAIIPCVGVSTGDNGKLQRIGFGKGFYDRYFAKVKKKPYKIFVQPELCFTNTAICDDYDITADILITPFVEIKSRKIYS